MKSVQFSEGRQILGDAQVGADAVPWGAYPIARGLGGCGRPQMDAIPESARRRPHRIVMSVDLPGTVSFSRPRIGFDAQVDPGRRTS